MRENKENILAILLAGIIAFLYISGLPSALFVRATIADVDPVCIVLLINILVVFGIGYGLCRLIIPQFKIGFTMFYFLKGLRKYGISCLVALLIPLIAFWMGLAPFNYQPTVWKVLIEGVLYYIGVGLMEEFFCRGLLQNTLEKIFSKRKNATLLAVVITAVIFGMGHIFGVIGMPIMLALSRIIWAVGLGIYLGAIYVRTKNIWLVAFFHAVIDLCGLPFCFTTTRIYPTFSAVMILITFLSLGMYGVYLIKGKSIKLSDTALFLLYVFLIPLVCIFLMGYMPGGNKGFVNFILYGIEGASPMIAVLLVIRQRYGYRGTLLFLKDKYRNGFCRRYCFMGFMAPIILLTFAKLIVLLTGYNHQLLAALSGKKILILLWALIAEELGWRGFLQERVEEKVGAVATPIMVGLIWSLWHFHFFLAGTMEVPFLLFTIGCIGESYGYYVITKLSKGNIIPASLWHFSGNLLFNIYLLNPSWNNGSIVPYAIATATYCLCIFLFAWYQKVYRGGEIRNEILSNEN